MVFRIYLQHRITTSAGEQIKRDYLKFNWHFVNNMKNNMKWGNCSGNSLFIAMEGDLVSLNFYNKKNYSEANKVIIFYNFYFNYLQG